MWKQQIAVLQNESSVTSSTSVTQSTHFMYHNLVRSKGSIMMAVMPWMPWSECKLYLLSKGNFEVQSLNRVRVHMLSFCLFAHKCYICHLVFACVRVWVMPSVNVDLGCKKMILIGQGCVEGMPLVRVGPCHPESGSLFACNGMHYALLCSITIIFAARANLQPCVNRWSACLMNSTVSSLKKVMLLCVQLVSIFMMNT